MAREIQEGDLVFIESMEGGMLGLQDFNEINYIQQDFIKSKYQPFLYPLEAHNPLIKSLFIVDLDIYKPGTPVQYGEYVRLKHWSSQQVLTASHEGSLNIQDKKLKFQEYDQINCLQRWFIRSQFESKQDGQKVHEGDDVILQACEEELGYLSVQEGKIVINKKQHIWRVYVYKKREIAEELYSSSFIMLKNIYYDGCLGSEYIAYLSGEEYQKNLQEIVQDMFGGEQMPVLNLSTNTLPQESFRTLQSQIKLQEISKYQDFIQKMSSLFLIESDKPRKFSKIDGQSNFRLINVQTGFYLAVDANQQLFMSKNKDQQTLFQFVNSNGYISQGNLVALKHVSTNTFIKVDSDNPKNIYSKQRQQCLHLETATKIQAEDQWLIILDKDNNSIQTY